MKNKIANSEKSILTTQLGLNLIGGKWKLPIIIAIASGHKKFTKIKDLIPGISSKMLSKELRLLESYKLVRRMVRDTYPVEIEYILTTDAEKLNKVIAELIKWTSSQEICRK